MEDRFLAKKVSGFFLFICVFFFFFFFGGLTGQGFLGGLGRRRPEGTAASVAEPADLWSPLFRKCGAACPGRHLGKEKVFSLRRTGCWGTPSQTLVPCFVSRLEEDGEGRGEGNIRRVSVLSRDS